MKRSLLILPMLISSGALLAQSPAVVTGPEGYPTAAVTMVVPASCPVSLQAKQGGFTDMVKVKDGDRAAPQIPRGPRQRIHLLVGRPADGRKIVSATVTARGLSARSRMHEALRDDSPASDLRRTLDIRFTPGENGAVVADLVLPGFTAVNSLKLESITFADGSTRDVSGKAFCSVVPDPIMLVADR